MTDSRPGITIRPLSDYDDLRRCVDFQHRIWGPGFTEAAPASILWVAVNTGGIVAAAFDEDDDIAGFLFGLTGWLHGEPIHWSDMLAVRHDLRGHGVGIMLKRYQRETLLDNGIATAVWTFDPLESRNAYLNLTRLGATAREYRRDCYGTSTSPLHALGTDRLVAHWALDSARVRQRIGSTTAVRGTGADDAAVINQGGAEPRLDLDAPRLRLLVPADIQALRAADLPAALAWRQRTRVALETYLGRGYAAVELIREDSAMSSYLLERAVDQDS